MDMMIAGLGLLGRLLFGAMVSLAILPFAQAVEINPEGTGQAVIVPAWTTTDGHSTLLSITAMANSPDPQKPAIAAFRLFNENGDTVFAASVYFRRGGDQWTLALGSTGTGQSTLVSNDDSCVLVSASNGVVVFNGQSEIPADHGYATLVGMGAAEEDTLASMMESADCFGLAPRWNVGAWRDDPGAGLVPAGEFDVETSLVNAERGTMFAIPSTGLSMFSDVVQHQPPSSELPNLGSVHDAGSSSGEAHARRCFQGDCETRTFSDPVWATHFALSAPVLEADYLIDPAVGARTEIILTSPLARLLDDTAHGFFMNALPIIDMRMFNRSGLGVASNGGTLCPATPPAGGCATGTFVPRAMYPLMIWRPQELASGQFTNDLTGIPLVPEVFPYVDPTHRLSYFSPIPNGPYAGRLRVENSAVYGGGATTAVIGVVLLQATNAYLTDSDGERVRANYGKALPMRRLRNAQN